ncbi:MAG: 4-hydroxyphenylacetate 3-hydroxylase N-terminal domain-containing protein [Candidatus Bathyarchaeia archaeon]
MVKTFEEYVESLRDGRVVYWNGERIEDVTKHPYFIEAIKRAGMDYKLSQDPKFQKILIEYEGGRPVYFVYKRMRNANDLLRKRAIIQFLMRMGGLGSRFTGIDAVQALCVATKIMDEDLGTDYYSKMEEYRKYFMENDLSLAMAMTDVKGNRTLRPWEQVQHKDFYLRVVERKSDGIIVRGAKAHISFAPIVNEMLVMPTRAMPDPRGKDYTIAFTIPVNTEGIKIICPEPPPEGGYPTDALVIFDDVFIPEERVFMNGEYQYAGVFARMFANFHRLSAGAYKTVEIERIVGAAKLMEEYNGLEGVGHVREKLAWLAWWYSCIEALNRAACERCVYDKRADMAYPNPILSNAAKFMYAEYYHQGIKFVQDIAGGIVATMPSFKDYENPETRPYIEKYLAGKDGVPTEHRLRAIKLAQSLTSCRHEVTTIHAEGSLQMQLLETYYSFDWERVKNTAKVAAGINPEEENKKWVKYALRDVNEAAGIEVEL